MARRINWSKILFVVFLVLFLSIYVYPILRNLIAGKNINLLAGQYSEECIADLDVQPIDKSVFDPKLNITFHLKDFEPAFSIEDEKLFENSDFFFLSGYIENSNDYGLFCSIRVNVQLDDVENYYYSNINVSENKINNFKIVIELPNGESNIYYEYDCIRNS